MKNTITACLVVYNEEKYIERCLKSIKNCVDEIVIVHDGPCADRTIKIASKYTNKIFVERRIGIAEPHRVVALEKAKGDWVMWLDADEILSQKASKEIRVLVRDCNVDCYKFIWPLWDGKKEVTKNWPWRPFLFRKSKLSYLGFPQEHFRTNGTEKNVELKILHRPNYNNLTWERFKNKWVSWAKIQADYYFLDFKSIPKFNYVVNDWSKTIKFSLKFPIFFALFGLYAFSLNYRSGAWKEGLAGLKSSLMWGMYVACVYYFILIKKLKG